MKSFEPCLENFRLGGEFYRLFEHIPKIMFFAKDRKRWLFMGNRRFLEHCGFTSVEELVGNPISKCLCMRRLISLLDLVRQESVLPIIRR